MELKDRIEAVLDKTVRPALGRDGGGVDIVDVSEDGVVKVRLKGACHGCPGAMMTINGIVEQTLKREIPEVKKVEPAS